MGPQRAGSSRLAGDYGISVIFRESTTVGIERPVGSGSAAEIIDVVPNPFLATVGLRVDPAPVGSGVGSGCSRAIFPQRACTSCSSSRRG